MANFTISKLKPTSVIDSTATIPCVYGGQTYQLEVSNLIEYFGTGNYSSIFSGDSILCNPNPITTTGVVSFNASGLMSLYGGTSDPDGWLICNGRTLPKTDTTYSNLYSVIGNTYGTPSDITKFQIPNMSGVSAFGLDNMGGVSASRMSSNNLNGATPTTLGSSGGSIQQTLTAAQCPLSTHSHHSGTLNFLLAWDNGADSGNASRTDRPERNFTLSSAAYYATPSQNAYADASLKSKSVGAAVQDSVTTSHPHVPPFILLNWIIKL